LAGSADTNHPVESQKNIFETENSWIRPILLNYEKAKLLDNVPAY